VIFDAQFSSSIIASMTFWTPKNCASCSVRTELPLISARPLKRDKSSSQIFSTEGARYQEEDASLFATCASIGADLHFGRRQSERRQGTRGRRRKTILRLLLTNSRISSRRPSPKNLDQSRGFGLHLTLANQFPRQILHAGAERSAGV